ncbi:Superfamily II DNA or RNA helicase [Pelagirhabdus alkalitolerans]|uniref:Superfamily II DNA or RNA helicase n=1 Tax=Pelagirhabdus alkalitolerans TaxID=1612202 RepID=A0A1G6I175_9BACI|nr:DEAD/DEAH box helicase family protein [Pelagirhabdus alkalitolerans]SDC00200.1 Superfamily II DNA or RNA helicase [Pelagirhabdus alkalitolerans]
MTKTKLIKENVVNDIKSGIECSSSTAILVSFMMKSGLELIMSSLQEALDSGAQIKILTGDYLYISQPEALDRLLDLKGDIEIRLWLSRGQSFHPKAYLFESNSANQLIIGSSNLSKSALTTGVEWNISVHQSNDSYIFEQAEDSFLKLFYHDQTVPINPETINQYRIEYNNYHEKFPGFIDNWHHREAEALMFTDVEPEYVKEHSIGYDSGGDLEPRPHQTLALNALEDTMNEQYDKALVVMATGLGKTFLAAFFAKQFKRVLFVAHREEILLQAKKSFEQVLTHESTGLYNQEVKDSEANHIFASVFTLSRNKHLHKFNQDDFDLIIVDEFHHAAARSYQGILDYFNPSFLLGLTATPDRLDGKDVYALCDGNVAFQMHFIEAIQHGYLTPFKYYGVYDDTDYSSITWLGRKYDPKELEKEQLKETLVEKIYHAWLKHKQTRTIVFCSSIRQAEYLGNYFKSQGVNAISLHSKTTSFSREDAIESIKTLELEVIFTVDLFNEGVDIPEVDTLLFVRPTESLTIYTQQVGRGLRLSEGKSHCHIIDMIGNYKNADVKMQLFDHSKSGQSKYAIVPEVPDNCELNLDVKVIDLIKHLVKKRQPRKERLLSSYFSLKKDLGRRPSYLEMHRLGYEDARQIKQEFKSYLGLLFYADELTEREAEMYREYKMLFEEVERTVMSKSYKMVVMKLMLDRGESLWAQPISADEIAYAFYEYLTSKDYRRLKDFNDKKTKKFITFEKNKITKLIEQMPFSKWSKSSNEMFSFDGKVFQLNMSIPTEIAQLLHQYINEIVHYRLESYFELTITK